MDLHTNIHLVTTEGLDNLSVIQVNQYQLPNDLKISEFGRTAFSETGFTYLFLTDCLFFVPVANDRNKTLLNELLKTELKAKSIQTAQITINPEQWTHTAPRILYFSTRSAISDLIPDAQFLKNYTVTLEKFNERNFRNGLQMRFVRVDQYGFAITFDLVQIKNDTDELIFSQIPPNATKRKATLDALVSKCIPTNGLKIHLGDREFVIPQLPLCFKME